MAHSIRCSLYHRSRVYIEHLGGVDNSRPILTATKQILDALKRSCTKDNPFVYLSQFKSLSRAYRNMDKPIRDKVIQYVAQERGVITDDDGRATKFAFNPQFLGNDDEL